MLTMKEDTMREMALLKDHDPGAVIITPEILGSVITQLMQPVMQTIGKMLENNTAALEQLSAAQSIQNDRLEALEKQIRLQTKVDGKQVSYLNDAIRRKSRAMLSEWEIDDGKAVRQLGNRIRKAVLARYGISTLRDVPKHEYNVAMQQVEMWNDVFDVSDIVKEARERIKEDHGESQT